MTESHRESLVRRSDTPADFDLERWYLKSIAQLGTSLTTTRMPATIVQHLSKALTDMFRPGAYLVVTTDLANDSQMITLSHGMPGGASSDDPRVRRTLAEGALLVTEVGSWMGAPIVAAGRPYGAVCVIPPDHVRYDEADLAALTGLTSLTGLALQGAHLFELLSVGKREWEATVDSIPQAFCIIDETGRVRRGNLAFCELVDIPVTDVPGRPWPELLPSEWGEPVGRALALGVSERLETDDRIHIVSALKVRRRDSHQTVLVFDDVTAREQLEEQLAQSAKMTAIGQLVAGVAHDLNGPLSSILGLSEYLTSGDVEISQHLSEPVGTIKREAERAATIVGQLLSFARKNNQIRSPHRIREILEATLSLMKNLLASVRVGVDLSVDDDLPAVLVNSSQMQQVFVNLINNAAQAIAETGLGDRIVISARRDDGPAVAITVCDNGPGIDDEHRSRVLEPFFTTRADSGGTGLGLSISAGIISEHGGSLTTEPHDGPGACFRIVLPAAVDPGVEAFPGLPPLPPRKILVVDTEPHMSGYLEATLRSWGHTVRVAANGEDAMSLLESFPAQLVISDLRLPDTSGRPLYDRLLDAHPGLARRVLFTIANEPGDRALRFLSSLEQPHLRKPFTLVQLQEALAAIDASD